MIVQVYQRCFNVYIWLKIKVELTYIYRRCFKVGKTTSKKLRRFNVGEPMLFQRWNWKLSQCMSIDVVSTLAEQRWNSIEIVPSIQYRWPNLVSILIFGWKWKLSQRIFISVASALRKEHWNNFTNISGTDIY